MVWFKKIRISFLLITLSTPVCAQLVYLKGNELAYRTYANQDETDSVNIVPDFSYAGYGKGGVVLPEAETIIIVEPSPGDCTSKLQSAIDQAALHPLNDQGIRGVILLKKGVYHIDGTLTVKSNGIVLRGEGNGQDGTVLVALQKTQHDFISIRGSKANAVVKGPKRKIVDDYVATGNKKFETVDNHQLTAGDQIIIQKIPNPQWIKLLEMEQYKWSAEQYKVLYERTVTDVKGNVITIDVPFVDPIDRRYGDAVVFKSGITGRISRCGVENLRIESGFVNNEDENHGWNAVVLSRAENCWVKNVVAKYFGYACVNIDSMSVFNTVQDCAMIDPKSVTTGGRKYSFNISHGSTGNLVQRCVTWGGRHDYVTGSKVPGPNVFLDCAAENTFADIGPHHRWATGLLFDNVYGGEIRAQNRKAMGSGHGWAGSQILFWNCYSVKREIKVESPPGAMNWAIGCIGPKQSGEGYWESWGAHVTPRSLYLKQLEDRLGTKAVMNVTTTDQRQRAIWSDLRDWAAQLASQGQTSMH